MNLFLRFIQLILTLGRIPVKGFDSTSSIEYTVKRTDSDVFQHHMTNSRFPAFMDLGRIHWMQQAGIHTPMRKRKMGVMIAATNTVFLGMARLGKTFALETRPLFYDHKYLYIEHRFIVNGKVATIGMAKLAFFGKEGTVAFTEVAKELAIELPDMACPPVLEDWMKTLKHRL